MRYTLIIVFNGLPWNDEKYEHFKTLKEAEAWSFVIDHTVKKAEIRDNVTKKVVRNLK